MSTATTSRPGFFYRLGRAFVNLLKLVLLLIVLVGIGVAAWFGYQELTRSFNSLATRNDLNAQRIEALRSDVSTLTTERAAQESQLDTLEEEVSTLDAEVAAMTEQLSADLEHQQEVLAQLETELTGLVASANVITENVDNLSAGVIALQGDVNENIAAVDELGGNVDELGTNVTDLNQEFGSLETEVMGVSGEAMTAVTELGQAVTLFRAWEMVYRARLRLLEQNAGLARQDVAVAQALLTMLVENSGGEPGETLAAVQQRLDLASAGLPTDPDTAVRDLESAWEMLDAILAELMGVPEIVMPQTAVITPTVTITATQPITTSP
jgi:chromosome segregation ATPase